MNRLKGILYGAVSSSTFGLTPLFSVCLLMAGYSPYEVLAYRWGVAAAALFLMGLLMGHGFRCRRADVPVLVLLSLLRAATSFGLVIAYRHIASGAAAIIHFLYPLAVTLGMILFFGEKRSLTVSVSLLLSLAGVVLLSFGGLGTAGEAAMLGVAGAVTSVFAYASYIIGVRTTRASRMDSMSLTFYVMAAGALLFMLGGWVLGDGIRLETDGTVWLYILGLALPSTALSNITLVKAIKLAGPTLTSLLGALEPLTAVLIGILVLGEPFTLSAIVGIVLIIFSVSLILLKRHKV